MGAVENAMLNLARENNKLMAQILAELQRLNQHFDMLYSRQPQQPINNYPHPVR